MRELVGILCGALLVLAGAAQAAPKLPSSADGYHHGAMYNGKQNMPYVLYGVAHKWHLACLKGKTAECLKLARAFETGENAGELKVDPRVGVAYYLKACELGSGVGCARAAVILRDGEAGFTNPDLSRQMAERGCNVLKDQPSCAALGSAMASSGDTAQAAALIDRACAAGADDGCRAKAFTLFYQKADAASRQQALAMFEPACAAKKAWGCLGLADAYGQGLGVPRDAARAGQAAAAGCTQGQGDRLRLCTLHGANLVASRDKATLNKGELFLDASCKGGDAMACNRIGMLGLARPAGATTTQKEGLYYLRRGCDFDLGESCSELGLAYLAGTGVDADNGIALALFDKACRLKHEPGCNSVREVTAGDPGARAQIPPIDPSLSVAEQLTRAKPAAQAGDERAVMTVVRLMQEGNEDAAWLLGGWLYYGLPGVFDTSRRNDGLILFENAARVGHVEAAVFMGMAYWYGDGVVEDRAKGERYMLIAASRGDEMAAAIYRSMKAEPIRQENARRQKEYQEWAASREAYWARSWNSWTPNSASYGSAYNPPSYSGPSVSSIIDNSNWNQRINYLSGYTSACPASNPYC